jgi:hypothetical protein
MEGFTEIPGWETMAALVPFPARQGLILGLVSIVIGY